MGDRFIVMRSFLDSVSKSGTRVAVIIKNGYQLHGRITNWDETSMLVDVDGIDRLVMLSAVSTIIPKE